jgi:hypothetical protein
MVVAVRNRHDRWPMMERKVFRLSRGYANTSVHLSGHAETRADAMRQGCRFRPNRNMRKQLRWR